MAAAQFSQFFTIDAQLVIFLWAGKAGKQGIEGLDIPFQAYSAGNFAFMLMQECAPLKAFIEQAGRKFLASTYLFCVSSKNQ